MPAKDFTTGQILILAAYAIVCIPGLILLLTNDTVKPVDLPVFPAKNDKIEDLFTGARGLITGVRYDERAKKFFQYVLNGPDEEVKEVPAELFKTRFKIISKHK